MTAFLWLTAIVVLVTLLRIVLVAAMKRWGGA